jgi:hypothetical protein
VLRAAGETETTQENAQDLLELDGKDNGFQLLREEEIAAVIFFFIFISTTCIIKFSAPSCASLIRISEGLLYYTAGSLIICVYSLY